MANISNQEIDETPVVHGITKEIFEQILIIE